MNTRDYIESGILEAYILGALSTEEQAQVAANIAMYPELGEELDAIELTMQRFGATLAIDPPSAVQDKIWTAINGAASMDDKRQPANAQHTPKTISFTPERKTFDWRVAAAVALLIGSVAMNFVLYNQGNQQREANTALNGKMEQLQTQQTQLARVVDDYKKSNTMMADTGMQTIVMHTMQPGHAMAATLYWSKAKGETYVAMNALPEPPKGMQYQLWVIQGGKPVSMGVLPNNMANTGGMRKVAMQVNAGEAFAISLEKEGGNPTPTTVYVLGKA